MELNPEFSAAYLQLGDAYLQQGDPDAALGAFRRAAALNGGRDSAQIVYALAVTGHQPRRGACLMRCSPRRVAATYPRSR